MKKQKESFSIYPVLIGALAFILRLWNTLSIGNDFYANFLSDASTYKVWATRLVAGGSYGEPVFQMGPLYPYFLALNIKLGLGFYSVLFIQDLLGALVAVMIFFIARSIFDIKAAVISGLLAAVFGPFIFYDGLLLSESIQIFLATAALGLMTIYKGRYRQTILFVSAILFGLVALGRATILFFPLILSLYWLLQFFKNRKGGIREIILRIAILLAGVAVGIMPAALHNIAAGDFVLISSNTGINFYIGNNARSTGTYDEPPGLDLGADFTGRQVAEREAGHPLKSSEVSSFWMNKAEVDIKKDPAAFIFGLLKKTWLYFWYFDISQAEAIQIQNIFSPLFALPVGGFGLLLILGLLGMIFGETTAENRRNLIIFFIANVIGAVLFFVIGRFKLLGALPLLICSGSGIMNLINALKRKNFRKLILYASVVIAIFSILILPRPVKTAEKIASAYDNVGIYYHFKNKQDEAIKWYRKAEHLAPDYSPCLNNIGTYFYSLGNLDSSAYYFHKSLLADPDEDKTLMNLGRIALEREQVDSARFYYEKARNAAPYGIAAQAALAELDRAGVGVSPLSGTASFDALLGSAEKFAARGQFDLAEKFYLEALKIKGDDIKALNNLGFAYQAQRKFLDAANKFAVVLRLSPGNAVAYNNLAGTIYQIGLIDSSITLWEKAVQLDPSNQQFKNNLEFVKKGRR